MIRGCDEPGVEQSEFSCLVHSNSGRGLRFQTGEQRPSPHVGFVRERILPRHEERVVRKRRSVCSNL